MYVFFNGNTELTAMNASLHGWYQVPKSAASFAGPAARPNNTSDDDDSDDDGSGGAAAAAAAVDTSGVFHLC